MPLAPKPMPPAPARHAEPPRATPGPTAAPRPAGDAEAQQTAWIERHLRGVWRYARVLGADRDEVDDLVQEAFLIALARGALTLPPAATGAFLRRTLRHLFLRRRRTEARADEALRQFADVVDALWARDAGGDEGDPLLAAARACADGLEGRARTAVQRAYGLDGGPPASRAELAAALAMTENGVKTLLQRTRQALLQCIERRRQ